MGTPGVFYGGGCSYMACRGLMMSGISDVLIITHGPVGCAYFSGVDPYLGERGRQPGHAGRVFSTAMGETDIIFGGEAKLAEAIDEAVETYHPAAIAICATCPVGLIGDDVAQVARDAAARHGIDVLPLSCEGFRSEPGWLHAGKQMLRQWVGRSSLPTGRFPIHFMSESYKGPRRKDVEELLGRLGYDVVCSLMGSTTYDQIRRSADARLVVLDSGKAIDAVPLMYQEAYGSGFLRVTFTGIENIAQSLRSMAGFFGDEGLARTTEQVLTEELGRIRPQLEAARDEFAGTLVAAFEDIFRSNDFATLSSELGMGVIMVAPDYTAERTTDKGFVIHVPEKLATTACEAAGISVGIGDHVERLPGCQDVAFPGDPAGWRRLVLDRPQVTAALRGLAPDLCFSGVEEHFGDLRCPMRNERFLSDERGCDYKGFDGIFRFVRDLRIARDLAHWSRGLPAWMGGDLA